MSQPRLIDFDTVGNSEIGFLSYGQHQSKIPFEIQRVYWIYGGDTVLERGNHAYKKGDQIILLMNGEVEVQLESPTGEKSSYLLQNRAQGLLVPGPYWRTASLSPGAVMITLASLPYDEDNYIRDYQAFKSQR